MFTTGEGSRESPIYKDIRLGCICGLLVCPGICISEGEASSGSCIGLGMCAFKKSLSNVERLYNTFHLLILRPDRLRKSIYMA
jgi:hypothetical protein